MAITRQQVRTRSAKRLGDNGRPTSVWCLCVQVTVRLEAEGTAPEAAQARGVERLAALSTAPSLLSAGVRVSAPAPRAAGMLQLGQLRGNAFGVRLRGVEAEWAVVERAAQSLKAYGFINYYVRSTLTRKLTRATIECR